MKELIIALALSCTPFAASAQADLFDYIEWSNKDGKSFEARLDHVEGDKVVLRAKKGGKRYPIKKDVLSEESKAQLAKFEAEVKEEFTKLPKPKHKYDYPPIPPTLIYRAVALGLGQQVIAKRRKSLLNIDRIRVTDRLTATLEFAEGSFKVFHASRGKEFFIKNKTLFLRSSAKGGSGYAYRLKLDSGSEVLLEEGAQFQLYINPDTTAVNWDSVGVSDGPVFQ